MSMKFMCPKGAVKDTKELEYLVALHQTTHEEIEQFRDGSIDDDDVRYFLMSRFGISVTNEEVRKCIFKGLAGGEGEDETLDIIELVAILVIPLLVKVSDSILGQNKTFATLTTEQQRLLPPETIIADVLQDILSDTTDGVASTSNPPPLTPHLLRQIFLQYDELDLVKDDQLIDEMIAVACGGMPGATLDVEAFARALSSDVNLYNPANETRHTEILTDVFPNGIKEEEEEIKKASFEEEEEWDMKSAGDDLTKVKTLSHMDYTADAFVHSLHVSILWLIIVFSYFFYMLGMHGSDFLKPPEGSGFLHKVGLAVLMWTITMTKLVTIGGVMGYCLGLGNGLPQKDLTGPSLGIIAIFILVFLPGFWKGRNGLFSTDLENSDEHSEWHYLGNLLIFFGLVLVWLQIKNIFEYMFPGSDNSKAYAVIDSIAGSNRQRAYRSKQAGIFKINQLVKNAYDLHKLDEKSRERTLLKSDRTDYTADESESSDTVPNTPHRTSSKAIALQNYADQVDDMELVGGYTWCVNEYFSGRMAATEGVWLPSRLLAANAIQFVAIIVCITIASVVFKGIIVDGLYPKLRPDSYSESCFTTFDYDQCSFPFKDSKYYAGFGVCSGVSLEGPECYNMLEPLNNTEALDGLIEGSCDGLRSAFMVAEGKMSETLVGKSCSDVLGAVRQYATEEALNMNADRSEIEANINRCYGVQRMTDEEIQDYNDWFDDDYITPDINNTTLSFCDDVLGKVKTHAFTEIAPAFEETAFQAFQMCMNAYGNIAMESPCERQLRFPSNNAKIFAYEQQSKTDGFCVPYVAACYIDPYNPTRGTCIIGESDTQVYEFEGPSCNTLKYYQEKFLPQDVPFERFFPERWMLIVVAISCIVSAGTVSLLTASMYIPSAIHTILKFRSGVIPSLKDPYFLKYRENLVNQTALIGAMFWGLMISTGMISFLVAVITYLMVVPGPREIAQNAAAQLFGITVTISLRRILCKFFLRSAYAGFYRKKPKFANAFMFSMECWNIALSIAFVFFRLFKFILVTGLYVGRIDRPVLAQGMALDIDMLPRVFLQTLLSAEAHKHPYMTQLGQMYLMKLRHKDNFGTKAGSMWRLLFVSALMPWLRTKRIRQDDVDIDDDLSSDQQRLLPPETIIADILQDILSDTTDGVASTSKPPEITPRLLKQIFVQYDELDLVKDDTLIDDMIAVASKGQPGATLDVAAFARALTTDVQLYDPENETRYTEIFSDVFPDGVEEEEEDKKSDTSGQSMKKVNTLSHMDFTADTYVHSMHVSMLWLVIVFSYFFYMLGVQGADWLQTDKAGFGYKVGYAVLRWTVTMLKLVILGGIFGFFLGLGNGLPKTSFVGPVLGVIAVACLVFLPGSYKGDTIFFDTDVENSPEHSSWPGLAKLLIVFGVVLVFLQLKNLFDYFMPSFEHSKVYSIIDSIAGSSTQRAFRSKQAGIFKINQLVKNAYDLHKLDEKSQERELLKSNRDQQTESKDTKHHASSKAIALQNYADQVDELEEVGGLLWSVKEYFSGRMAGTEGIWLPSRLLAANAIQFVAIIVCITAASIIFRDVIDIFYPKALPDELIVNPSCNTTFDYEKCYFPFEERGAYVGVGVCREVSLEGPECYDLFEPLNSTEGLDGLIGSTCASLEAAFAKVEAEVTETLLGANCSTILGAARDFAVNEADEDWTPEAVEYLINRCYGISTMTEETRKKYNEWLDDDTFFPDITDSDLELCQAVGDYVKTAAFSELAPGFEDSAFQAFQMCMSAYGSIAMESPCESNLLHPTGEMYAYEKDSSGGDFCVTFVSACYIDIYRPTRATCIIGEHDDDLFRFSGPTCNNYPQINNTMIYYEQNGGDGLSVASFFPEKWSLYLTAVISIVAGSIVAIITAGAYIPSSIHTVLKFRSGVIPSLKDPNFLKYRNGLVNQTYMIGAMFWGLVVTTLMVTILVAIITFLLVWPASRDVVINLCAQVLGIVATILLRMVMCMVFLKTAYAGFYRTMPAFANAFMFGLECWNIALTAAYVLSRLVKFLVATGLYVGRIDRPVLAEGLALDIDSLPRVFRQNLLSAEAHRHPYMVQLGGMYLMKLRHKDDFGTKAGSIWRLLFVSALMPWLRKKRIQDEVDIDADMTSRVDGWRDSGAPVEENPGRLSRASFKAEP